MNFTKNQIIVLAVGVSVFLILILTGVLLGLKQTSNGILAAALNLNQQPLFDNTDNFVLFADKGIELKQKIQISSGNLGSNDKIDVQKDVIINGNLFAKEITIDKDTTINGNVSYNKLKLHKDSRILGATSSPVKLPIANPPDIPDFPVGNQDFNFSGQNNTLSPGNYRNIILGRGSRLTLTGGTYNLRKLELKENSTLIYNSSTTINIQFQLKAENQADILAGNNHLSATDLTVNYLGGKDKDNGVKPVHFGNDSFFNFKLLAPKADVKLGERTTLRGQVLARGIKVGKDSILSREDIFSKDSDPAKIIEENHEKFLLNEIILILADGAAFTDAQNIANVVNGRITGFVDLPQTYKIEVVVGANTELDNLIAIIESQNNPLVLFVSRNSLSGLR